MTSGNERRSARLVLEDGSVFRGTGFGARGVTRIAEIVFNTAMSGYQESLTDPSYTGQILLQTFPMVGIVGVNPDDEESPGVRVAGLVVRELVRRPSNYRSREDLDTYLARHGVPGIEGIDTREVTRRIRTGGAMRAAISDDASLTDAALLERVAAAPRMGGQNLAAVAGCGAPIDWTESLGEWAPRATPEGGEPWRVLALDCGAKRNILRHLAERGCVVRVVPHTIGAEEILAGFGRGEVDGVFVSNGPGDPAAVEETVATLRELMAPDAPRIPIFGICLGHQLLALALGATTYKLKFGHRGANQPVLNRMRDRVEITSQNHGFAVDADSLARVGAEATHVHLNDQTVAGFRLRNRPVLAVQYHPEASPGPHDAADHFDAFVEMMRAGRAARAVGASR